MTELDDFAGHDLANRIIAIHQIKRLLGPIERRVQLFNLFWTDFTVHEQAIDRRAGTISQARKNKNIKR